MPSHLIEAISAVFTAIGTVAVAILAIWGDRIRDRLFGPRIKLSQVDPKGDLTVRGSGSKVYFYHLRAKNQQGRNASTGTRIMLQGLSRRAPSGRFVREPLVYPLQFCWTPSEWGEVERTIVDEDTCDFGCVGEDDLIFRPVLLGTPNNFRGLVEKDSCVRFEIAATGRNVVSRLPLILEVSWDGHWSENQEEIQRHLIIKEVPEL